MTILIFLALPALLALLSPLLGKLLPRHAGYVYAGSILAAALWAVAGLNGPAPSLSLDWIPELGIRFDLAADGLGSLFLVLVLGIGSLILYYAQGYFKGQPQQATKLYGLLLFFMFSMVGVVLADNVIVLFVFWELTSGSAYLLIGVNNEDPKARGNALQALLVTGFGGVAMLAGWILLIDVAGTQRLSEMVKLGSELASAPTANAALILILLGAMTKSAQFPFHFWLPNAMAAPTPVSAYLHSATMVKAGVFLLLKVYPIFGSMPLWTAILVPAGAITLIYAAINGLFQRDLKRILAFTTLSVLGLLTLLIGLGGELAIKSALLFLVGHALYKAALFMCAGNIDHETGTRDVRILGGLRAAMPLTALAAALAALSKGGFPPLLGFVSKEYVYKASIDLEALAPYISGLLLVGNAMLLALAFKVGIHPFWAKAPEKAEGKAWSRFLPHNPHEAPVSMLAGPLVLALAGIVLGIFPGLWTNALVQPALATALGETVALKVALWHGFNQALGLSALTVTLGLSIYLAREWFWRRSHYAQNLSDTDTEKAYDLGFQQFVERSKQLTSILQNGSLRFYLITILAAAGALVTIKLAKLGAEPLDTQLSAFDFRHLVLALAIAGGGIYAAVARNALNALCGLGLTGYGIALLFAFSSAPDLALTQILVETLSIIILLIATRSFSERITNVDRRKMASLAVALCSGLIAAFLVFKASSLQLAPVISDQLAAWSYLEAKGRNVVNVILVDFRALDTFGEISVLAIAAFGVTLCLRGMNLETGPAQGNDRAIDSPILRHGARILLPIATAISLVTLYRGHNEPGGGFIGGLVFAIGLATYSLAFGTKEAQRTVRFAPKAYIGLGLAVALAAALLPLCIGKPFFTGMWLPAFSLPLLGSQHLGTPLLFDVGVYLVVIGFSLQPLFLFQRMAFQRFDPRPTPPQPQPEKQLTNS